MRLLGQKVYFLVENKPTWKRVHMSSIYGATIANCGGMLVAVGGCNNAASYCKEVMVLKEWKWTVMSKMLVGCRGSCVVSLGGGSLVVMGGLGEGKRPLNVVQVFEDKTQAWHYGPPIPKPTYEMSAVIHRDEIFVMGGRGMAKAVWRANIGDLMVSHEALYSISIYHVW